MKYKNSVFPILTGKNFEQKIYFCLLKMRSIFFKEDEFNFYIKLGQRLPKSFSELHVKNSSFFLSYFLKKKKKTISPMYTPAQGYGLSPTFWKKKILFF